VLFLNIFGLLFKYYGMGTYWHGMKEKVFLVGQDTSTPSPSLKKSFYQQGEKFVSTVGLYSHVMGFYGGLRGTEAM